ncbi:MAG: hypothetical protein M1816_001910, partial [Peltula sp. TS41687]
MTQVHRDDHVAGTSELFKSGDFSDLLIRSGGKEFRVHRAIICPRSKFFAKACTGRFSEAFSGEINLADDEPDTVARMLSYLYTTDYDDGSHRKTEGSDEEETEETDAQHEGEAEADADGDILIDIDPPPSPLAENDEAPPEEDAPNVATIASAPESEHEGSEGSVEGVATDDEKDDDGKSKVGSSLLNNALVYGIGEKYDIPGLKLLAKEYFSACAALHWPPENIQEIIKLVYESTPDNDRGLREIVTNLCLPHLDDLMKSDSFQATLLEQSAFCRDVLRESTAASDRSFVDLTIRLSDVATEKQDLERRLLAEGLELRRKVTVLTTQLAQADENIKTVERIQAEYQECRHCDKPFNNWYIDTGYTRSGPVILR